MKKRLLSLVLCLVMIFSLVPFTAAAAGDDALYEEVTPADGRAWRTTDSYNFGENGEYVQLYANIDGNYVPVDPVTFDTYNKAAVPEGGWTAESANQTYNANPRTDKNLFYHVAGNQYSIVYTTWENYYRNGGNPIPAANLCNSGFWGDWGWNYAVDTPVTYYYTPENVNVEEPSWHRVYSNITGVNTVYKIGHFADLWYYTKVEEASYVTSGRTYDTQLDLGNVARVPKTRNEGGWGGHGNYEVYVNNGTGLNKPTEDYIGGNLYVRVVGNHDNHYRLNEMHTETGQVLAWPLTQEIVNAADSDVPGSSTYGGDLYYHDQGVSKLVRQDGTTLKDCDEKTGYNEAIYSGKLYVRLPDNTRYVLDLPQPTATTYPDQSTVSNPGTASDETGKVHLDKALSQGENGTYKLTLESFASAGGTTIEKIKKTPTDFVVVVDESGSMNDSDIPASYSAVTAKTLEQVAAGNYYVNVNGEYYRVFAKRGYLFEKFPSNTLWTNDIVKDSEEGLRWFQSTTEAEFTKANQYYIHEDSGAFRPVTVTVRGVVGTYYVKFFTHPGGDESVAPEYFDRGSQPWYHSVTGGTIKPGNLTYGAVNGAVKTLYPDSEAYTYSTFVGIKTGMFINRDMYKRHVGYTGLYYRDMNGDEWPVQIAGSSLQTDTEYCNSKGEAVTTDGGKDRMTYEGLYQAGRTMTRLQALKNALNDFAAAVAADTDSDGVVNNRVAVVGFASTARNISNGLVAASDGNGGVSSALSGAISNITANGGTQPETGLNMAKDILDSRSADDKANRNTVVIFFTDGRPGDYAYMDQYLEANDVVVAAKQIKDLTYGTAADPMHPTIYSIGVFGESDGNPLLYPRSRSDLRTPVSDTANKDYEYEGGYMEKIQDGWNSYYYMKRQWRNDNVNYTENPNDTIFDYMSVVSSNYPNATTFIHQDWVDPTKRFEGNYVDATEGVRGTHLSTNDYYRMASTQATLVAAFEEAITKTVKIEMKDETTSVLDTKAEIRDKINVDLFDVSHATYTVKKVPVMAVVQDPVNENGVANTYHWSVEYDASRASEEAVIGTANQPVPASGIITASGLDYATEYVNRRHAGFKLVVEVTGLVPKQFNTDVASNYGTADLYPDGAAAPMVSVESPIVNVYRAPVTVTWKNWDDSVIYTDDSVPYGAVPEYTRETPTREPDSDYTYTFSGWDPEVGPITTDTTYKAQFTQKGFESTTVVADFNSKIVIAEDSSSDGIKDVDHNGSGEMNGTFAVDEQDHQAYYQLNSSAVNGSNTSGDTAMSLTPYSGSDYARIYGRHVDLETGFAADEAAWKKVTVYPATNVYFSDETANISTRANDQIGYAVGVYPDSAVNDGAITTGSRYFEFQGTRVDVYGTTTSESGTITAYLYTKNDQGELKKFKSKMVSMASDAGTNTRYNAPIVSFSEVDGMDPDTTYYLRVYAAAAAKLRLDGIRVYNADNNTLDKEKKAIYVNLRDMLLSANTAMSVTSETNGVAFFTDKGNFKPSDVDNSTLEELIAKDDVFKKNIPIDYKNVGPKNEVYLAYGQSIGFIVPDGCSVMVSMRVPEGGNAQLEINGDDKNLMTLDSAVDMYYPIQPKDGVVLIKNVTPVGQKVIEITEKEYNEHQGETGYRYDTDVNKYFKVVEGETFVSLMNVKRTGTPAAANGAKKLLASPKLISFAANPVVQTEEPAAEPTATPAPTATPVPAETPAPTATPAPAETPAPTAPAPTPTPRTSVTSIVRQLISSFVNSLFGSMSRLFGK